MTAALIALAAWLGLGFLVAPRLGRFLRGIDDALAELPDVDDWEMWAREMEGAS